MKRFILLSAFILFVASAGNADALYFRYEGGNTGGSYSSGASNYSSAYALSEPLTASCAPMQASARVGEIMSWYSSTEGGTGSYQLYWSGTDGLGGNTSSIQRAYATPGEKFATLTVSSGGQNITVSCTRAVSIFALSPVPVAAAAVVTAVKQPVKKSAGEDKTVVPCEKLATTTKEEILPVAGVVNAGIDSPFLLILLALGAIGIAIFLAMRKKEKEERKVWSQRV
jgi:hypothetical protein